MKKKDKQYNTFLDTKPGHIIESTAIEIQLGWPRRLWSTAFTYLDRTNYAIDDFLVEARIPVKFIFNEIHCPSGKYALCTMRVKNKYKVKIAKEILPALHNKLTEEDGDEYLQWVQQVGNVVIQAMNQMKKEEK